MGVHQSLAKPSSFLFLATILVTGIAISAAIYEIAKANNRMADLLQREQERCYIVGEE